MGHRKRPSLHILFESFEILDKIEIWANRKGEKIIPWSRQALINQARYETRQEIMSKTANVSVLEALGILREIAGPEVSARARQHAENYLEEVKANAAKNFK